MEPLVLGTGIFVACYAIIITERVHKTVVALFGGMLVIVLRILSQEEAFEAVDFNVIFLLAGMMILANTMAKTGVFQWLAIWAAKVARGRPFFILLLFSALTAVLSAFLDNVTTVVLVAPVTVFLASLLQMDPRPLLLAEIMASNIGGTATLIGDPPNILIGSAANLDFVDFLANLAPVVLLIFPVYVLIAWLLWRDRLQVPAERRAEVMQMQEAEALTDVGLLKKGLVVLALTLVGFLLHGPLGYEPATIALLGAATLMWVGGQDPHESLREVEWSTLFFFVGLFILVGGIVHVGLIKLVAQGILELVGNNPALTAMLILWMSALLSGVIDNIPYTASIIPLVQELGAFMPVEPLWWSLALGTCLGGNLTSIAASANVVVIHLAARSGYPITFREFLLPGFLVTLVSILISTIYIWLRYL